VPAVLVLARLQGKKKVVAKSPNRLLVALMTFAQRNRGWLRFALVGAFVVAVPLATRIDTHNDNSAFFSKGSPPDRAEAFLQEHFGGSQFLQVEIEGDMTNPAVLRELSHVADRIASMPDVASVQHLGDILSLMNDAMSGDRTTPDTQAKAKLLYGFLEGKRAVRQFVTDDRDRALMQVKLRSNKPEDSERALAAIRALVKDHEGVRVIATLDSGAKGAGRGARPRGHDRARRGARREVQGDAPRDGPGRAGDRAHSEEAPGADRGRGEGAARVPRLRRVHRRRPGGARRREGAHRGRRGEARPRPQHRRARRSRSAPRWTPSPRTRSPAIWRAPSRRRSARRGAASAPSRGPGRS
jgi:hypothetical protein